MEERAIDNTAVHDRDAIGRAVAPPGRAVWLTQRGFPWPRGGHSKHRAKRGMIRHHIRDPNRYGVERRRLVPHGAIDAAPNHDVALPTERVEARPDRAGNLQVFASTMEDC